MQKQTTIPLTDPARAIRRLCKHFSHKVQADWDEAQGTVHFPMGMCYFTATAQSLHVRCEAAAPDATDAVANIVETHVYQMLWREVDKAAGLQWQVSA